jgi:hypothetical protein
VLVARKDAKSLINAARWSEANRFAGRLSVALLELDLLDVGACSIPIAVQFIPDLAIWIIFRKYLVYTVLTPII